jgi:hypothetical protein
VRLSGFTLVRHGVEFDFPFKESLLSLLPLVDELVVNVGIGRDSTLTELQILRDTHPEGQKLKLFESDWGLDDPEKKRGGLILSEQTNLALSHTTGDWCVYLQADEVLHEDDLAILKAELNSLRARPDIDALVFQYRHFYGSYDIVQDTRSAYRREVRAIRKSSGAKSIGDAQSFRGPTGEKLRAVLSKARIFHYGWVRPPEAMREKTQFMDSLYHGGSGSEPSVTGDNHRYKRFWGLKRYLASHPAVMKNRIERKNWSWDLEGSPRVWSREDFKKVILDSFERLTGVRLFEYKSYRLTK